MFVNRVVLCVNLMYYFSVTFSPTILLQQHENIHALSCGSSSKMSSSEFTKCWKFKLQSGKFCCYNYIV